MGKSKRGKGKERKSWSKKGKRWENQEVGGRERDGKNS